MTYRNILVHVDTSKAAKKRVEAAAALAVRFKSFLTGVFLKADTVPAHLVSDAITTPTANIDQRLEERACQMFAACASARSIFNCTVDEASIPFRWVEIGGDRNDELVACARRHDLVVVPVTMTPALAHTKIHAAQIGMACGGPVLVLPQSGYQETVGRKILVAWNDSRESARALRDAWPFLAQAEEIHFLTVGRHGRKVLDKLLELHFREHDCRLPNVIVDNRDDIVTGNVISRHIGMTGADMAVLGLYGRSRMLEFILGGVSRELLEEMPVPLLMSH